MIALPFRSVRAQWAIVVALGAVLFFPFLGRRDLWVPDEARYAEVAREMVERGEWIVPHLGGEIYAAKPPLHFWAIALFGGLLGRWSDFTVRIPSALAAIGTLWAVFELGRRLVSANAGWYGVFALGSGAKFQWQGHSAQIDMTLTLFVSLAILAWAVAYLENRPRLYPLFWVFAALASLAKGPIGLIIPLLATLTYLGMRRDWQGLSALRVGRGLALWSIILLVWFLPAALSAGVEYAKTVGFGETVVRYVQPWHHVRPWYFYLWTIPVSFLPWTPFLASAVAAGLWQPPGKARDAFLLATTWALTTFLFFSVSPGKRDIYMVPMLPALALLVGGALDRVATAWPRRRGWLEAPMLLIAVGCLAIAGVLGTMGERVGDLSGGDSGAVRIAITLLAALGVVAAGAWALMRGGHPRRGVGAFAIGAAACSFGAMTLLAPRFDAQQSFKAVGERVARIPADHAYALYGDLRNSRNIQVAYYGHRQPILLSDDSSVRVYAAGPGVRWVAAERALFERLGAQVPSASALPSPTRWSWALCRVHLDPAGRLRCEVA